MRTRKRQSKTAHEWQMCQITVSSRPREPHRGVLRCGWLRLPCALGRAGVTHVKREGDGATPAGRYSLLHLLFRRDRVPRPRAAAPVRPLRPDDGWCEDLSHGRYNCPVRLPRAGIHDRMWREDHLYDVVGILDWNVRPRVCGRGSAIFLHLARPGFLPTAGCIALSERDLARLLAASGPRTAFVVGAVPQRAARRSRSCRHRFFHRPKKRLLQE